MSLLSMPFRGGEGVPVHKLHANPCLVIVETRVDTCEDKARPPARAVGVPALVPYTAHLEVGLGPDVVAVVRRGGLVQYLEQRGAWTRVARFQRN